MRASGAGKGTADEVGGGGEDACEVGDMKIWRGLGTGVVEGMIVIEPVCILMNHYMLYSGSEEKRVEVNYYCEICIV